jgi:hypothetical protein
MKIRNRFSTTLRVTPLFQTRIGAEGDNHSVANHAWYFSRAFEAVPISLGRTMKIGI